MNAKTRATPKDPRLDFHGKKLAGRSFRKQNLAGADFSGYDLRGVDFCGADLTGANFKGARMGKDWKWGLEFILFGTLAGFSIGLLLITGLALLSIGLSPVFLFLFGGVLDSEKIKYLPLLVFLIIQKMFTIFVRHKKIQPYLIFIVVFLLLPLLVSTLNAPLEFIKLASAIIVAVILINEVVIAACIGVLYWAGIWGVFGVVAGVFTVTFAHTGNISNDFIIMTLDKANISDATLAVLATLNLGWILSIYALQLESSELDWLRRLSLRIRTLGGTDFQYTILVNANFSQADMKHTRLAGAQLAGTRWHGVRNLHLADTYSTVLQPKAVRELLTTKAPLVGLDLSSIKAPLAGLNLSGLDFSDMNLAEADCRDADFSGANLAKTDLTAANVSRAVLLGADLRGARLTGAIIAHWNIDKHTRFDDAECEYVYLDEAGHERQPASGVFRPGEFAKLYQEIADTVDFLIENPAQMEALLASLNKLRRDFGDPEVARVAKVEEKDGAWKVGVAVPPELVDTLRAELHREYAAQLKTLENEHHYALRLEQQQASQLQREVSRLESLLVQAISRPVIIHNENTAMNDHSRKIEHSTIHQSAVNLGDHATTKNTAQPGADAARLLAQLRELIDAAPELPAPLKQAAREQVETLGKIALPPDGPAKQTASRAIGALETAAKLAGGMSGLLAELGRLFGV